MVQYIKCSQLDDDLAFQAFKEGFSDYIIRFEAKKDFFLNHFFGPEGNKRDFSWLAMEDDRPVGLVLGGIRKFDGLKTMRCGTMCVVPGYRRRGIASALLEKHRESAIENGCRQLFLECIERNDKALTFYRKEGYEVRHHLHYFTLAAPSSLSVSSDAPSPVSLSINDVRSLREESAVHWNWQNEMDYIEQDGSEFFGIMADGKTAGAIAVKGTKISFLYIREAYRDRGFARILTTHAAAGKEKLTVSFPDNDSLAGFYEKLGFQREPIRQVEMYRPVK